MWRHWVTHWGLNSPHDKSNPCPHRVSPWVLSVLTIVFTTGKIFVFPFHRLQEWGSESWSPQRLDSNPGFPNSYSDLIFKLPDGLQLHLVLSSFCHENNKLLSTISMEKWEILKTSLHCIVFKACFKVKAMTAIHVQVAYELCWLSAYIFFFITFNVRKWMIIPIIIPTCREGNWEPRVK